MALAAGRRPQRSARRQCGAKANPARIKRAPPRGRAVDLDASRRGTRRRRGRSRARARCRRPPAVSAGPSPRTKRSKTCSPDLVGDPGAVVGDLEHGVAVLAAAAERGRSSPRACGGARSRAGCRTRRWSSSGLPSIGRAAEQSESSVRPLGDRLGLLERLRRRSRRGRSRCGRSGARRRRGRAAAGRRPAATSAGWSRARSRPRAGPRGRVLERAWSSSRLACTLVSGVRSSCEASATNSRWRSKARSRSVRGLVERLEHLVHRLRQLADLVVGGGDRHPPGRVAGGGDLARRARSARRSGASRGRRRRARRAAPGSCRRARRRARNSQSRSIVASTSWCGLARTGRRRSSGACSDALAGDAEGAGVRDLAARRARGRTVGFGRGAAGARRRRRSGSRRRRPSRSRRCRGLVDDRRRTPGPCRRRSRRRGRPPRSASSSLKSSRMRSPTRLPRTPREDDQDQEGQPRAGDRDPPADRDALEPGESRPGHQPGP